MPEELKQTIKKEPELEKVKITKRVEPRAQNSESKAQKVQSNSIIHKINHEEKEGFLFTEVIPRP